ncbi:MAG TPA: S-methyl-5-thioribose-1-phosphate isomerase [Candidatus Atribacteria bacterium]|nr:S-methyl-5-thioribose-1-phosphate isomerase [Candidatus Atribacteria bacterium]HPU08183.1 S-methyl-5-thioribose-1-phosphate isomerase [Candidatus Atribacteria bacterium]HQE25111.1 S-methyl-5-thioribose-1-phosphate isomerase [Candidatus Atribacteria bacterium]
MLKAVEWKDETLQFLDQTLLPEEEVYIETADYREVVEAIHQLKIRGAPLLGVAAAYGLCLGAIEGEKSKVRDLFSFLEKVDENLRTSRPTAVNLSWALDRLKNIWEKGKKEDWPPREVVNSLIDEAKKIEEEDYKNNEKIARHGAQLLEDGDRVLTHCNTGSLACSGWGTALGAISWAVLQEGKKIQVYADETRPLWQGARLTAFELMKNSIPVTVICDNMAGYLMSQKLVDKVIVGADRVTLQGDAANKIGTYSLAVLSHYHKIPFYMAFPLSSVDFNIKEGKEIPIEERNPEEVIAPRGMRIAPIGVGVRNPAFDVTPHHLITALITEKGIIYPPFEQTLSNWKTEV